MTISPKLEGANEGGVEDEVFARHLHRFTLSTCTCTFSLTLPPYAPPTVPSPQVNAVFEPELDWETFSIRVKEADLANVGACGGGQYTWQLITRILRLRYYLGQYWIIHTQMCGSVRSPRSSPRSPFRS